MIIRAEYQNAHVKQLLWRLKSDRAQSAARDMAEMTSTLLKAIPKEDGLLTHLPTAASRVRLRGYDQSQLFTKQLARLTGIPYQNLLRHVGKAEQKGANKTTRLQQANHAYRLRMGPRFDGTTIVLVDDVMTTGASLEAATKLLKRAGAAQVWTVAFAFAALEDDKPTH